MRSRRKNSEVVANFDLSVSDLMAALLQIFILLLFATLLKVNEYQGKSKIAEKFEALSTELYQDLNREFQLDYQKWDATLDRKTMSFLFRSPEALFLPNASDLRPRFQDILDDFFPRLVRVLNSPKYRDSIEEIRIEGHTVRETGKDPEQDYLEGILLSQSRTTEVLKYCLVRTIEGRPDQAWVRAKTVANGYSYSKPVLLVDGQVDPVRDHSRRVEFRIRTNLQLVVDELVDEGRKYQ